MSGKSLVLLALAILSGLAAMYGTNRMLTKGRSEAPSDMVDVLVAARDLKVEEVLTPELVKVDPRSRATLPPGTFASFKDVEDRWVQIKTLQDEPILDRKLAPKGSPAGLVARISKGMRAYTIEVNEQTGVSGFILPDHHVDVVQINPSGSNPNTAETILEDVQVLASGQVFVRPDDRSIQARTVTLAVTPEQVDILVAARARGAVSLALRGLNDHTTTKPEPAVAKVALPPPPPPPPVAVPPPPPPEPPKLQAHYVWIYRGPNNKTPIQLDASDSDDRISPRAGEMNARDRRSPPLTPTPTEAIRVGAILPREDRPTPPHDALLDETP
ncbi:MAG: Flp pilus assembly protein CpaB [Planctomycetaceae bacterium]|nr:Flp pilus assembly protein CpaB [Planctomycetaceae bacterium]